MSVVAERVADISAEPAPDIKIDAGHPSTFEAYLYPIVQSWLRVLVLLGVILVPLFLVLDYFTMPLRLLERFAIYRAITTLLLLFEFFLVRKMKPGPWNNVHGYVFALATGGMISRMTVDLGGFDSSYYAGLILVIIAVNMLLSWSPLHSLLNGILTLAIYLGMNLFESHPFEPRNLINNLYFLSSTIIITVSISWLRYNLVRTEYDLRSRLVRTNRQLEESRAEVLRGRDRLWGEMQLAKLIQTALLPDKPEIGYYETAAIMLPTEEVGGDYYDLIEAADSNWVAIGDVSGHGVDSGLLMMMAQTSVYSIIQARPDSSPAQVLAHTNRVLKENIMRLGAELYLTVLLMRLEDNSVTFAGKHTDWILFRARTNTVEIVPTTGTWLGFSDNVADVLEDATYPIERGDIIMLYTDGITESRNEAGELFGEERLARVLLENARQPLKKVGQAAFAEVMNFSAHQTDDISLVLLRNRGYSSVPPS